MKARFGILALLCIQTSIFSLPTFGSSQGHFDLDADDQKVCKVSYVDGKRDEAGKVCYLLTENPTGAVELLEMAKARLDYFVSERESLSPDDVDKIGGALLIEPELIEGLVKNYKRISIRNFALDPSRLVETDNETVVPFVVDIYWKGVGITQGTLHGEGLLTVSKEVLDPNPDSFGSVEFSSYSDSFTELKSDSARWLETTARTTHFEFINGVSSEVDQATMDLLTKVVAPVLLGEVIYLPVLKEAGYLEPELFTP